MCVGDDEHFYFTPQLDLINLVSCSDRDEFWDTYAAGPGKDHAIVCWQLILKGAVFQCHFDLARFPLDSQDLVIRLQSAQHAEDVVLCRNMNPRYRSVVQPGALLAAHEYTVSRFLHMHALVTRKEESGSGTPRPGLRVQMRVRRSPLFWALNVWLPLFCFTGVSFASFAVEVTALSNRLSITITLWLVLAAYRFTIMDNLPKTNCVTYLDMYCQACFLVCFAVSVHAVSLAVRAEVSLPELALDGTAAAAASWAEPIAWQASQRGALLGCSIAWLSINLLLPLVIFLQRHVLPSGRETIRWWDAADNVLWFRGISDVHGEVNAADRVALRDHIVACMPAESAKLKSRVHFKSIMPYCELKPAISASKKSSSVDNGTSGFIATVRKTVNGWLGASTSADVGHTRGNSLVHQNSMMQDSTERRALLKYLEKCAALIAFLLPAPRNLGYALLELQHEDTAAAVCAVLEAAAKVAHTEPGADGLPLHELNAWIRDNWQTGSAECSTPRTRAKRSLDEAGKRKPDYVVQIALPEYKCLLKRPWWDLAPEPAKEASVSAAPLDKPDDKLAASEADGTEPAAAAPEAAAHVAVSVPRQGAVLHETAAAAAEEQAEAEEAAAAAPAVHPAEADEARCAAAAADVGSAPRDSHAETASPAEESV